MIQELTKEEFLSTMSAKMINVTETAEPVVDIWPYVSELTAAGIVSKIVYERQFVEKVYRNVNQCLDQILLPTSDENVFIVIVINFDKRIIVGHYTLDLADEYGLR
jgi:hypothetical protein